MSAQISYIPRRRRRPPPILPIEPRPIAINTATPEERPIVPVLEPAAAPPLKQWSAMDEIGRLGEVVKNRQAAPIEDVPRWKAALMSVLASLGHVNNRPLAPGESAAARILGTVAGAGITGAAVPAIEGQRRKDVHVAQAEEDYQRAIENQKKVVGIETDQILNRRREAEIPYIEARPDIERAKVESIDTHREESRDLKRQANESLNDYRNRVLGDRRAANESLEAYRERMGDLRERGLTERERHNRITEGARQEGLGIQREGLDLREQGVDIQREGLELRRRKAEPITPEVKVGGVSLIRGQGTPRPARGAVRLSEAEILAKFPNDPAKAAAAIKRARSRGLL